MEPKQLKKLSELYEQDLSGWKITQCHFLELGHCLMGMFPALTVNGEIVVTFDKCQLKKVWDHIEKLRAKVTSLTVIAHIDSGVVFNLGGDSGGNTKPLNIVSDKAIDALCKKKDPFKWAPGLMQIPTLPISELDFS